MKDGAKQQIERIAEAFLTTDLAGIADATDLLARAERLTQPLSEAEIQLVREHFGETFKRAGELNQSSRARRAGEFSLCGHAFYYNGGGWQFNDSDSEVVYHGHGLAWTRRKHNLLENPVTVSAVVTHSDPVDAEDRREQGYGFNVGLTLNARHWYDEQADGVTISTGTRFSAIRSRVFSVEPEPLVFRRGGAFQLHVAYEVQARMASDEMSLRLRPAGSGGEFQVVLHRILSPADVRHFNIPLISHVALFSYGLGAETFSRLKVKVSDLRIAG